MNPNDIKSAEGAPEQYVRSSATSRWHPLKTLFRGKHKPGASGVLYAKTYCNRVFRHYEVSNGPVKTADFCDNCLRKAEVCASV